MELGVAARGEYHAAAIWQSHRAHAACGRGDKCNNPLEQRPARHQRCACVFMTVHIGLIVSEAHMLWHPLQRQEHCATRCQKDPLGLQHKEVQLCP